MTSVESSSGNVRPASPLACIAGAGLVELVEAHAVDHVIGIVAVLLSRLGSSSDVAWSSQKLNPASVVSTEIGKTAVDQAFIAATRAGAFRRGDLCDVQHRSRGLAYCAVAPAYRVTRCARLQYRIVCIGRSNGETAEAHGAEIHHVISHVAGGRGIEAEIGEHGPAGDLVVNPGAGVRCRGCAPLFDAGGLTPGDDRHGDAGLFSILSPAPSRALKALISPVPASK